LNAPWPPKRLAKAKLSFHCELRGR
jgi:hypothetical protein